jgi:hypothetical protein
MKGRIHEVKSIKKADVIIRRRNNLLLVEVKMNPSVEREVDRILKGKELICC